MSSDERERAGELLAISLYPHRSKEEALDETFRSGRLDVSRSGAIRAIIAALRGASGGGADGLRAIEAARKEWFCSGADCTEYDHGRDEGFELAIAAYRKAAPAAPGPADQPAENGKSPGEVRVALERIEQLEQVLRRISTAQVAFDAHPVGVIETLKDWARAALARSGKGEG
ncbi:hypothetical protein HY78_08445 [Rhizorhabdus wittichii DC-6]|nr:hypothetical protein HY78_08445 [Rhizorhabdus wittichii DC-6]